MVHEAYLRLIRDQQFDGRGHFFAATAEAMRRVLVDHVRDRNRLSPTAVGDKLALPRSHGGGNMARQPTVGEVRGWAAEVEAVGGLVCGDAYLIDGQSNAEATDVGKEDPKYTSEWIRTFGSPAGDPANARKPGWGKAVVRSRTGGQFQIGSWGMELARRLVENQKVPVCIINGAVGGMRVDQHQRNPADPTDMTTIYGRLLWHVRQAKLTHGVRAVFWHQGENDQGPTGRPAGTGTRRTASSSWKWPAGGRPTTRTCGTTTCSRSGRRRARWG